MESPLTSVNFFTVPDLLSDIGENDDGIVAMMGEIKPERCSINGLLERVYDRGVMAVEEEFGFASAVLSCLASGRRSLG
jgi:hypothetical protein